MANFLPLPTRSRRTCRFQEILTRKFALASNNATQHNRVQAPFIAGGARLQTRPPHSLLLPTFQTKHYAHFLKLTNNLQIICKLVATHRQDSCVQEEAGDLEEENFCRKAAAREVPHNSPN